MKKTVTMILMVLATTMVGAQDLAHYKRVIKELSSAKYQERGYAKGGANKAGKYLQREFEKAGVDEVTLQPFKLDINTFCGKMQMWADGQKLRGSNYYVEHPIVPLSQIKYLFNIDMIGDYNPVQYCEVSNEGMQGYNLFEKINAEKHHFKALHRGDLAANSDHYPFATRHVPCIFLENEKGDALQYYHTIFDTYQTVRFDSYKPVFSLVRDFVEQY